ncbi:MAG: tetratricopeptide repeat protein, partial [Terracidiphilus sp.]
NNYGTAVVYYQEALRADRRNAVLYDKLGIAELLLGERGAARKHFALALKYNPRYVAAINNLGVVALLEKKYKPSIGYFKEALALEESNAPIHVNLAEAWIGMNETDRAMTEYARALELDADVLSSSNEGIQAQFSTHETRQHRRSPGVFGQSQRAAVQRSGQGVCRPGFLPSLEGSPFG